MKNLHFIAFVFFFSFFCAGNCYSQLAAHSVHVIKWCKAPTGAPAPYLGGSPTATGGVAPYRYQWTCITTITPTSFLDNDTIANPQATHWVFGPKFLDYQVRVTDSTGTVAYDTTRIYVSGFAYSLDPCDVQKGITDTIMLVPSITGGPYGYDPISYYWTPGTFLSNDSAQYPACWATVSTTYMVHAVDSIGCTDSALAPCLIEVGSTGVTPVLFENNNISIYPDPITDASVIQTPPAYLGATIFFYTIDGRRITNVELTATHTPVPQKILSLPFNLYTYLVVGLKGEIAAKGMLMK